MIRQKKMAGNAEYAYFDYGLVAVLIFLICFGLIMLLQHELLFCSD